MKTAQNTNVLAYFAQTRDQSQTIRTAGRGTMVVRATGAQTGNAIAVVEFVFAPGSGFPMHIHHNEEEMLYILEGRLLFVCGGNRIEAEPGTFIFGPRLIPTRLPST